MNKRAMVFGVLALIAATGPSSRAAVKDFDNGGGDGLFLTAANWNDAIGSDDNTLPGPSDRAIINGGFTASYGTSTTTTLGSLIVGADWPVTGNTGTSGTLNMSAGRIIVTGGGDNFQIGRACCGGEGAVNLSGDAVLEIGGSDPVIGTRDTGVLNVGGSAKVVPTNVGGAYWRLGNYGHNTDISASLPTGLEGNGTLYVHDSGSFEANVIFIADNDAVGLLHVADNGSVALTSNLIPRPSGGLQTVGSATVQMDGSKATLSAYNLESESLAGEVPTKYVFNGDSLGFSAIKLVDAINITNNALEVNLQTFSLPNNSSVRLFDGDQALAGSRIFGTFSSVKVNGVLNPANYSVIYDQAQGDILLARVPEPATVALLGLATVLGLSTKRRSRS